LPAPVGPPIDPQHPLTVSPALQALNSYVAGHPLTINDAVAIAMTTSRSFAASVAALLRAQGRTAEARAALNPTLAAAAQITEFDAPTVANLSAFSSGSAGGSSSAPATIPILNQFNPVLTANANLPLDIAGTLRAAASEAQFQEVAARIEVNRTRNQVVYDTKNAFYNVLRAQAQVVVATDTVNNALSRLNDAQKNYAAGTSPRFDVITATTDVANAQQSLIQARVQVSVNLAVLKNVIGLDNRTPLRITDQGAVEIPPGVSPPADAGPLPPAAGKSGTGLPTNVPPTETPAPMPAAPIGPDQAMGKSGMGVGQTQPQTATGTVEDPIDLGPEYNGLLEEALRTRPDVLEADANIAAARRGIQVARASQLPSLSFGLGYTYTPNAAGFSRVNQGAATLSVSVPIFDGGLSRARVKEARATVADAENSRRQAVDQVALDLQQAYLALIQARDQVQVANVGLTQAREAARLARVRYNAGVSQQAGVSPILELSNAQTSLAQAESNQVNALYNYNSARAQLDRAIGRYSYAPPGPGLQAPPAPGRQPQRH
jgi:outer membrane protein TolC